MLNNILDESCTCFMGEIIQSDMNLFPVNFSRVFEGRDFFKEYIYIFTILLCNIESRYVAQNCLRASQCSDRASVVLKRLFNHFDILRQSTINLILNLTNSIK